MTNDEPRVTLEELDELERLHRKASPPPWFAKGEGVCCGVYQGEPGRQGHPIDLEDPTWADAALIAASRTALPRLIATARELLRRRADRLPDKEKPCTSS